MKNTMATTLTTLRGLKGNLLNEKIINIVNSFKLIGEQIGAYEYNYEVDERTKYELGQLYTMIYNFNIYEVSVSEIEELINDLIFSIELLNI